MKKQILLLLLLFALLILTGCNTKEGGKVKVLMKTSLGDIEIELDQENAPITVENFVKLAIGEKEYTDAKTRETVKGNFYDGLIFHRVIQNFMIQGGCPIGNGTGDPGYKFQDEFVYEEEEVLSGLVDNQEKWGYVNQDIIVPYMSRFQTEEEFLAGVNKELLELFDECERLQSLEPIFAKDFAFFERVTGSQPISKKSVKNTVDYGTICMANSGPNTNGSQFFIVTNKDGCSWLNGKHTVFGKVVKGMDVVHKIEDVQTSQNDKPIEDVVIKSIRLIK